MNATTLEECIALCKRRKMKGYSGKTLEELQTLLTQPTPEKSICRLNYIGSKFQLLDWLDTTILEKTGWTSFNGKTVADLFSGTGIVSHNYRMKGATTISNDAELYSAIITSAISLSVYSDVCNTRIKQLNQEMTDNLHAATAGFITQKYSPYDGNERMFFTVENARRIDWIRHRIEEMNLSESDNDFMLASLLLSADAVSNVPAVYGCYLKNFKSKATKPLLLKPVHTITEFANPDSISYNADVLSLPPVNADMVYLDPPYNERQYSKNYFPLNMIALTEEQQAAEAPLKGKTGIPEGCFISPFCKKGDVVIEAFENLFKNLNTEWIFLSYSTEAIVSKDDMLTLMRKFGEASVVERDYKRFKSFEYNQDIDIKEYLYCLRKNRAQ
jgi:adenine-specific DNA-methyltransferase